MNKTTKTANAFITVSVLLSFVPVLGGIAGAVTLLVGFILSIVATARNESGGVRVLISSILAVPLMVAINLAMIAWLGGA